MRQITNNAINAFMQAKKFGGGNTTVQVLPNVTVLLLFGNEIAYRYNDPGRTLSITNAGWDTVITKERLNAIPGVNIQQKDFTWYLNGKKWNGDLIDIEK